MKLSAPIYQLKRRAKHMAREERIPLHVAQEHIARSEGFATWSLLAAKATGGIAPGLLARAEDGDLVLLAARPGHGKTLVALRTLLDARRAGRRALLFTLDMTIEEAREHLAAMGDPRHAAAVEVETSDEIDAAFVIAALDGAAPGTVAVIDYLQPLDQCRTKLPLGEQIEALGRFAARQGVVLVFLSQIDRNFDRSGRTAPGTGDLRLPNPVAIEAFGKRLFLHEGEARLERNAA